MLYLCIVKRINGSAKVGENGDSELINNFTNQHKN